MSESFVYRPHLEAEAQARLMALSDSTAADLEAWNELDSFRFELVSRGDFVPGRLHLPPRPSRQGPAPLILLQHDVGGSMKDEALAFAGSWAKAGWAIAMIDLPLHGERSSPKLSRRLVAGIGALARCETLDPDTAVLVEEFARQSTSDLLRTLEGLSALESIDPDRIGFIGCGLGALVGSYLLTHDKGLRCAALVCTGKGMACSGIPDAHRALDPSQYLARPRANEAPVLIVARDGDDCIPVASVRALYETASEPKQWALVDDRPSGNEGLSSKALTEIQGFFSRTLAA